MRPTINYDFSRLHDAFNNMILAGKPTHSDLSTIKSELNKFFKGSKCTDVFYTDNTDKMFFGMRVYANFDSNKVYDYLMGNDKINIYEYSIEIDSHLLNPVLGLTPEELTAILLHEVGHLVNDSSPIEHAREYLDTYMADNNDSLRMSDSIHYKEILAYGLKDYLSKQGSMFYTAGDQELLADDFAKTYGYLDDLMSAMDKIVKNNSKLYVGSDKVDTFITFAWTLGLYKSLGTRRVGALRTLSKAKQITGSRLERREMENVIRRIKRIDDDSLLTEANVKISSAVKTKMRKMRYDNLRSIEDDLYEFNMRIRNVEDEEDALYLIRQINNRIGIIDDYLRDDPDMDKNERTRWINTLDKFKSLRETLTKSTVYRSRSYGLYVAYPEIKQDNY